MASPILTRVSERFPGFGDGAAGADFAEAFAADLAAGFADDAEEERFLRAAPFLRGDSDLDFDFFDGMGGSSGIGCGAITATVGSVVPTRSGRRHRGRRTGISGI